MDIKLDTTTWIKNKNTNNINEFQHPREQYIPKIVFGRPQTGVEKEYLREKNSNNPSSNKISIKT